MPIFSGITQEPAEPVIKENFALDNKSALTESAELVSKRLIPVLSVKTDNFA